ncbi:MAG: hypothetical protein HFJ80_07110 [Clostridiales bacterium]|nr:hypothetical protein [Clostridiales bacterium]
MQLKIHVITIEDLAPASHLLQKLDAVLDFSLFMKKLPAGITSDVAVRLSILLCW